MRVNGHMVYARTANLEPRDNGVVLGVPFDVGSSEAVVLRSLYIRKNKAARCVGIRYGTLNLMGRNPIPLETMFYWVCPSRHAQRVNPAVELQFIFELQCATRIDVAVGLAFSHRWTRI